MFKYLFVVVGEAALALIHGAHHTVLGRGVEVGKGQHAVEALDRLVRLTEPPSITLPTTTTPAISKKKATRNPSIILTHTRKHNAHSRIQNAAMGTGKMM